MGFQNQVQWVLLTGLTGLAAYGAWRMYAAEALQKNLPVVARPIPAQRVIGSPADSYLDRTPPRQTTGLDLVKLGWTYNCMDCHKLLEAKWHYDRPMVEHEHIRLEHGNNRFCLNCHHRVNRNAFADYDGSEIAEADVVLLCGKCHGPTYRDWQAGVHGRRNGYWKAALGVQTRLRCIECHDPHQPRYRALQPLTAPVYPARAAYPPKSQETHPGRSHSSASSGGSGWSASLANAPFP